MCDVCDVCVCGHREDTVKLKASKASKASKACHPRCPLPAPLHMHLSTYIRMHTYILGTCACVLCACVCSVCAAGALLSANSPAIARATSPKQRANQRQRSAAGAVVRAVALAAASAPSRTAKQQLAYPQQQQRLLRECLYFCSACSSVSAGADGQAAASIVAAPFVSVVAPFAPVRPSSTHTHTHTHAHTHTHTHTPLSSVLVLL